MSCCRCASQDSRKLLSAHPYATTRFGARAICFRALYINQRTMAQTYNRVAVWGSGLRPRAVASAEIALPPSAYNTTRLQGTNRKQWPAPHPMRGGDFRSSTFAGAPVARGSSARALPPDVYNLGRLSGGNKRVAPVGQPRTPATRAALMRGDVATGQLSTKAKASKAKADAPQSSFNIEEIVAGLRAALESAESDEERDVLNEQLATLRPFVLLSKNAPSRTRNRASWTR